MTSIPKKLLKILVFVATSSLFISCSTLVSNKKTSNSLQTTVTNVDLDDYQGTWYEIARLPMYFQRNCRRDVTATYRKRADGTIKVTNKCIDKRGNQMVANGVASADANYPDAKNSRLLVSFLPKSLQWLPVGKGGYWILALDTDAKTGNYNHVLIGSPSRKYLWILSRTPNMSEVDYQRYVAIAKAQGYELDKLIRTTHSD
ncbi:lipocalin family protein [Psychrobacter sp. HD31]|uniref:lipocalin family protein n=1 Tax=Psychrobacter sp. HD31 TaxID=3112003 RepID=UPI003DA5E86F